MLKPVLVPEMGEQKQTETILNFWYVEAGQDVKIGDDLAELVTDKAAFNLPASENGRVARILIKEGTTVKAGDKIAEMETD